MKRKEYALVDVFKLIFAIAVVIIHTQLYSKCSDSFIWFLSALFTRLAVPTGVNLQTKQTVLYKPNPNTTQRTKTRNQDTNQFNRTAVRSQS